MTRPPPRSESVSALDTICSCHTQSCPRRAVSSSPSSRLPSSCNHVVPPLLLEEPLLMFLNSRAPTQSLMRNSRPLLHKICGRRRRNQRSKLEKGELFQHQSNGNWSGDNIYNNNER